MKKLVKQFLELVKIDSESGHEAKMIEYLMNWFKKQNLNYKMDSQGNLVGYVAGWGEPLVLCAHMDTVKPGTNVSPIIKDGVIKSNGQTVLGADNKAALAAILSAVEGELMKPVPKKLELLFTVKEEVGDNLHDFPKDWLKGKTVLLFDHAKPLGAIVLGSPFIINFYLKIKGKAAHASMPEQGHNAIMFISKLMSKIKPGYHNQKATTVNYGLVSGGTTLNTIPENCSLSGEIRSNDKVLFEKWVNLLKQAASEIAARLLLSAELKFDGYCPGYQHSKKLRIIEKIKKVYQKVGLKTKFYAYSGVSDANLLNQKGYFAINLGDGVANPHTLTEEIKISDLVSLSQIVIACLNKI